MTEEVKEPAEQLLDVLKSIGYEGIKAEDQHAHVLGRLLRADWKDAGVIEYADYLLFPDELIKRKADGSWERTPVMLRVPREADKRKARLEARNIMIGQRLDETKDRDFFANLECVCTLAYAIRNVTPPHEPWEPDPMILERRYDTTCLQNMWAKLDRLHEVLNPAPNQLSNAEIVALIAAIGRSRNLTPLVVYGPGAQTSFVVSMVDLLLNSMGSKLSPASIERLMPGSSPSPSSSP